MNTATLKNVYETYMYKNSSKILKNLILFTSPMVCLLIGILIIDSDHYDDTTCYRPYEHVIFNLILYFNVYFILTLEHLHKFNIQKYNMMSLCYKFIFVEYLALFSWYIAIFTRLKCTSKYTNIKNSMLYSYIYISMIQHAMIIFVTIICICFLNKLKYLQNSTPVTTNQVAINQVNQVSPVILQEKLQEDDQLIDYNARSSRELSLNV
jgi:hypothetical protein